MKRENPPRHRRAGLWLILCLGIAILTAGLVAACSRPWPRRAVTAPSNTTDPGVNTIYSQATGLFVGLASRDEDLQGGELWPIHGQPQIHVLEPLADALAAEPPSSAIRLALAYMAQYPEDIGPPVTPTLPLEWVLLSPRAYTETTMVWQEIVQEISSGQPGSIAMIERPISRVITFTAQDDLAATIDALNQAAGTQENLDTLQGLWISALLVERPVDGGERRWTLHAFDPGPEGSPIPGEEHKTFCCRTLRCRPRSPRWWKRICRTTWGCKPSICR